MPSQETGESGSGCGGNFFEMSSTQHSNVCHRTAMADTQLLEHSLGSGLDHENRLLWRVPRVCEVCLSTVAVENHVLWRLSHSENLHRVQNRLDSASYFSFVFFFLFSRYNSTCCFSRKTKCSFVVFVLFCFVSFSFLSRTGSNGCRRRNLFLLVAYCQHADKNQLVRR